MSNRLTVRELTEKYTGKFTEMEIRMLLKVFGIQPVATTEAAKGKKPSSLYDGDRFAAAVALIDNFKQ